MIRGERFAEIDQVGREPRLEWWKILLHLPERSETAKPVLGVERFSGVLSMELTVCPQLPMRRTESFSRGRRRKHARCPSSLLAVPGLNFIGAESKLDKGRERRRKSLINVALSSRG